MHRIRLAAIFTCVIPFNMCNRISFSDKLIKLSSGKERNGMAEVSPNVRKAVDWISKMSSEEGGKTSIPLLIEQASARFDLSPKDADFLHRFFADQKNAAAKKA